MEVMAWKFEEEKKEIANSKEQCFGFTVLFCRLSS